jgi:Capsule polysaccharide biosynthesis protein
MHFVTLGATQLLVENLWERIAAKGGFRFSHLVHPITDRESWENGPVPRNAHFFCEHATPPLPNPDRALLSSLEGPGIPTIHNMILGDRIVSKLDYRDALAYSTFLTRRLMSLYEALRPTAVIGAFDALHGSLGFAVAKKMDIPWFALNFSVIPPGFACFCDRLSPSARVKLSEQPLYDMRSVAESSLAKFESRKIEAPAYITPLPRSFTGKIAKLPDRILALQRTVRRARRRQYLKFVEDPSGHDVAAALRLFRRTARARSALSTIQTVTEPPSIPYTFFGLHTQPESSIDVWAPFFSNQMWVVELLARSIPPTHKLLVKIHKSDAANYSREQLHRMRSFPGVELVGPLADTHRFIEKADLVFSIQGTIGLEGALLGKPVIVLGDSPVAMFPSASPIGKIIDLPELIGRRLAERPPTRKQILDAFKEFLLPFAPAGHNDWTIKPDDREIEGYAKLFSALSRLLQMRGADSTGVISSR